MPTESNCVSALNFIFYWGLLKKKIRGAQCHVEYRNLRFR